jgi:hypothetical protein
MAVKLVFTGLLLLGVAPVSTAADSNAWNGNPKSEQLVMGTPPKVVIALCTPNVTGTNEGGFEFRSTPTQANPTRRGQPR